MLSKFLTMLTICLMLTGVALAQSTMQGGEKMGNSKSMKTDSKFMMEASLGGMRQLELSRVAVQKATNAEVKAFAEAEVAEQEMLSEKMKELAAKKGVTLPTAPDAKTQAMMMKMQNMSGTAFDQAYVKEAGVKGHQKLEKMFSSYQTKGTDADLKAVVEMALPMIRQHLATSQKMMTDMKKMKKDSSNSNNSTSGNK